MIEELIIKSNISITQTSINVEQKTIYFGNLNKGKKFKMHGIARNNVAESIVNNTRRSNIRSTIPPISIALWIEQSLMMVLKYLSQIDNLHKNEIPYTSIGVRFLEK